MSALPDLAPAAALEALVISARGVARVASELEQLIERAVHVPEVLIQLLGVNVDLDPATATAALRLSTQCPDGLGQLLSTVRARHVDLLIVQAELTHRFGSLVEGCGDPRGPRVGGGEQIAPAEGAPS